MDRIIALIDMDCFYVQVEQRASQRPELLSHPCAVVQYKTYKGGGIISLNYEAKALGVKRRGMMGDEAMAVCPSLHLFRVPESRGKADLTRYREAGAEVIDVMVNSNVGCVERASIDEAYIDMTDEITHRLNSSSFAVQKNQLPNTIVAGFESESGAVGNQAVQSSVDIWLQHITNSDEANDCEDDRRLCIGAAIVEELRAEILAKTQFRCSAGISHNKVLAKLACGMNKPNKQTVLPKASVHHVFEKTRICDVRSFGGIFGKQVTDTLGVEFMAELCQFSENELQSRLGERGSFVYNMCRGIDKEPVVSRQIVQSVGCSKNFLGKEMLSTREKVEYWLKNLASEVCERLVKDREKHSRIAKTLTVTLSYVAFPTRQSATRCMAITRYDAAKIASDALSILGQFNTAPANQSTWSPAIMHLGLLAGKFVSYGSNNAGSLHKFITHSSSSSASTGKLNFDRASLACENPTAESQSLNDEDICVGELESADVIDTTSDKSDDEQQNVIETLSTSNVTANEVGENWRVNDVDDDGPSGRELSISNVDENDEPAAANIDPSDMVSCDRCGNSVSAWDLPEHLDWHVALDIQNAERSQSKTTNSSTLTAAPTSASSRKRKSVSDKKQQQGKSQCRSPVKGVKKLDSFFPSTNR